MARKFELLLGLLIFLFYSCTRDQDNFKAVLPSPDSKIHVYFYLNNGEPYFLLYHKNEILIDWSLLGLTISENIKFSEGLKVEKWKSKSMSSNDELKFKGGSSLSENYNDLQVVLKKESPELIRCIFIVRAYNNGVAICYKFSDENKRRFFTVLSDETQFDLYGSDSLWSYTAWNNNSENIPEADSLALTDVIDLPARFNLKNETSIMITESEVAGIPSGKLLNRSTGEPNFSFQYDEPGLNEGYTLESGKQTSWKAIIISQSN